MLAALCGRARTQPAASGGGGGGNSPSISNVTGTVSGGNTLTVAGTQLINEDVTPYDAWLTATRRGFEGTSPASDGFDTDGSATYVSSPALLGAKAMRTNFVGSGVEDTTLFRPQVTPPATHYLRTYVRMHQTSGGWLTFQNKSFAAYGSGISIILRMTPTQWDLFYNGSGGYDNHPFSNPDGTLVMDRWYCVEWFVTNSPSTVTVWCDGAQVCSVSPNDSGFTDHFDFGAFNSVATTGSNLDIYWDGFAIGTARMYPLSLVEIGNGSNHATATLKKQAMTALSDTSIAVTCDLTGLGAGPYWLFVTNNRQLTASYAL